MVAPLPAESYCQTTRTPSSWRVPTVDFQIAFRLRQLPGRAPATPTVRQQAWPVLAWLLVGQYICLDFLGYLFHCQLTVQHFDNERIREGLGEVARKP